MIAAISEIIFKFSHNTFISRITSIVYTSPVFCPPVEA
jgi:hypothetical protein